jgi:hypothetical protein
MQSTNKMIEQRRQGQAALELLREIRAYIDATDMDHHGTYPSIQHCACLGRIESIIDKAKALLEEANG